MTHPSAAWFVAVLAGLLGLSTIVHAQAASATLQGTVVDESAAVVPDVRITVVNLSTGLQRSASAGARGAFVVSLLPPGRYRVTAQRDGFVTAEIQDLALNVGDALEVKLLLRVAGVGADVTVTAEPPRVSTSPAVGTVVDRQFVGNLPLNGGSVQTLILLTPGVVATPSTFNDQGQFSVNGQRADANYFTIDGVSANFGVTGYFPMMQTASGALPALSASGGTNSLVSVDGLQEFRIQTSTFAPEFGRTPGGQVSIVTRSGSNAFHGSLFEHFRHDALDAKDWFTNLNALPKPEQRQHDFGGVIGGPLSRNRTFFFFSGEGLRLRQPSSKQTAVPDAAARQQAPASTRPYLSAFPLPNGPALRPGLAQFSASYANPSTLDAYSLRLDHHVNAKVNVFGRYNYSPSSLDQRGGTFSSGAVLSATSSLSSAVHTTTIGATQILGQASSNELRANFSSHRVGINYRMDDFGGAVPLPDSLLFPSGYSSADSGFLLLVSGVGQYAQGKIGTDEQRQINLVDNLSLVTGSHQWKFGVDYRWLAPASSPFSYRQFIQFTSVTAAPGGALSGTAAFVQPGLFQQTSFRTQNLSLYGQDTWNVTRRLTATYGLRWDVNPPLKGKDQASEPFTVTGLSTPASLALAPRGTPLYQTTYGNVAPRVGLAYQLNESAKWQSVVRGGFGRFYDLGQGMLGGVTSYFPFFSTKIVQPSPTPLPLSVQDATPPPFTTDAPVATILVADPQLKLPRTHQWNIALEQSLGTSQAMLVTYLGAAGRDLLRATQLFGPNPSFQSVVVTDNSATSDYKALQLKFQRRLSQGAQWVASYTLAHSTDNVSTDAANYHTTPGPAGADADRGDSDFDIRHAFSAGVTYQLPSLQSRTIVGALLRDWSVDAFLFARSAPPVDIVGAISFAGGTALASRPNLNGGVPLELYGAQYPGGKIFNKAAFSVAPSGQQGNLGRNALRGFAASQADVAVDRQVTIGRGLRVRFRAQFFNIFNQPNFGNPVNDLTSPLFGRSTQTLASSLGSGGANGGFSPLYQIGGPRSIQLGVRLEY
jgi:hypothetical protein